MLLFDIVLFDKLDCNFLVKVGVECVFKVCFVVFMDNDCVRLIEVGNFEDDLKKFKDVDWVLEVIIEKFDVKYDLWEKVEKVVKKMVIILLNFLGIFMYL